MKVRDAKGRRDGNSGYTRALGSEAPGKAHISRSINCNDIFALSLNDKSATSFELAALFVQWTEFLKERIYPSRFSSWAFWSS